jgi:hypothetical protein
MFLSSFLPLLVTLPDCNRWGSGKQNKPKETYIQIKANEYL